MEQKQGGYHPGVTWDSEEDHLLSYFLGDPNGVQSTGQFSGATDPEREPRSVVTGVRTPAVQFYASSSSKGSTVPRAAPLGSASSSSSSLSSMAATLVSGGPVLHQFHHHPSHRPPSTSPPSISPISPAATMGTPQEMLMLPPPPRNPADQSEIERRQQHIAWLNQVNAMAMMNQQQVVVAPYTLVPTPVYPPPAQQQQPPQESEERRAKRLARNRESARQSRRRKKENLARLSAMVNGLQGEIEEERRLKLNDMEDNLQELRRDAIEKLPNDVVNHESICELLDTLGPNCMIRQNCTSFQYLALRQLMLPKYQVFILWLTIRPEGFFTAGKEDRIKVDPTRAIGRLSSKQIGEDISNSWKKELPKVDKNAPCRDELLDADDRALKSGPDEPSRLWPLVCYELSISVDQEEKLLNFFKSARESPTLAADRSDMSDATKMVSNMKRGILNHGQSTAGRSENLFLSTLSPDQSAKYFKWYAQNADRVKRTPPAAFIKKEPVETKESSLSDLCKRLHDVLRIPDTGKDMYNCEELGKPELDLE